MLLFSSHLAMLDIILWDIQPAITNPIKVLINKSIDQSVFPEKIKADQVSPLFKKHNSLDKSNYRPISVLPTISKFYELFSSHLAMLDIILWDEV
jgi:hypothetical protein